MSDPRPEGSRTGQISADLRRRIADGEFPAGMRLPSEAALSAAYGTTRSVIRGALARLARLSLVASRPRGGWVVQDPNQTQGFARVQSFTEWATEGGRKPGGMITSRMVSPADPREAQHFRIRLGDPLLRFVRVRTLDSRPVMIERSTWAPWVDDVIVGVPDDVRSTTAVLAEAGIRVASTNHRIEAVSATTEDAEMLGIRRSSPLLQVGRATTTGEGRLVELGVDRYRAGVIAFEIEAGQTVRAAL
ncbi:GntR family transcriptional regulator [Microbacterium panaciterrae]|uniref:GntR family transcriptional regulator n=1 Tax=Microbacterium panaciterrae TaxID=985759 RepID=UPI0031EA6E4B